MKFTFYYRDMNVFRNVFVFPILRVTKIVLRPLCLGIFLESDALDILYKFVCVLCKTSSVGIAIPNPGILAAFSNPVIPGLDACLRPIPEFLD